MSSEGRLWPSFTELALDKYQLKDAGNSGISRENGGKIRACNERASLWKSLGRRRGSQLGEGRKEKGGGKKKNGKKKKQLQNTEPQRLSTAPDLGGLQGKGGYLEIGWDGGTGGKGVGYHQEKD